MPSSEVIDMENRRLKLKLRVSALVVGAGVARSTYDRWVAGKIEPNLGTLRRVSAFLDEAEAEAALCGPDEGAPAKDEAAA